MSGNSSGEELFSDARRISPMRPEFPILTKCEKCETIFWLNKMKHIGEYEWDEEENLNWKKVDYAKFLNIEEYFRALKEGLAENIQEELFIRQRILWEYNVRIRNGENPFNDLNDEINWRDNCIKMISLLDESDLDQRILIAEIKRNLGDFESCLEIIKKIDNLNLKWIQDIYINECEKGNKWVIKLY